MHILLVIVVGSVVFVINIIAVGLLAALCAKKIDFQPKKETDKDKTHRSC